MSKWVWLGSAKLAIAYHGLAQHLVGLERPLELLHSHLFVLKGLAYFRARDPNFDADKTHAIWADSIQKMKDANMNLVSSYFPWDYHAPSKGTWDFTGPRDVDHFLSMVCDAGLKVIAKPGPLITGEWPRGFGSYGAIPDWWKAANPDALAKKADGSDFDFNANPLAQTSKQPSYLHPTYLADVEGWFEVIVPIIRKYVDTGCVVAVQVDNETNLYWSDRFGVVDYNPVAITHFRSRLLPSSSSP